MACVLDHPTIKSIDLIDIMVKKTSQTGIEGTMTSLVADNLAAVPRPRGPRDALGSTATPPGLADDVPCLGITLGLAAVAWASVSAVALLLV
jgi:hypothetical protein